MAHIHGAGVAVVSDEAWAALAARLAAVLLADPDAVLEEAAGLLETEDTLLFDTNALSAIGTLVSIAVRRKVLRAMLLAQKLNLARTAAALRIPSGAPPVARMIRDLGLQPWYEAQRAAGGGARGGRPRRPRP